MSSLAATAAPALSPGQCLRYGLLGLPLAFVALPLYVLLPNHYAREFGMPLATLGAALLVARLFDACVDPWIGTASDRLLARGASRLLRAAALCAMALGLGFAGLFMPPESVRPHLLVWLVLVLAVTYLGYSGLSVAHQSWGALLGGDAVQRSRIVAWREGLGVVGVVLASIAPLLFGLPGTVALMVAALVLAFWTWSLAPRPTRMPTSDGAGIATAWRSADFRRLLAVFVINGTASAIPATLVLFFVQDRLQGDGRVEAAALTIYFAMAAVALPLWLRLVPRWGLARCWLTGMLLSVAAFAWAAGLGAGDTIPFLAICALTGVALATDLAMPGAMLAGVIAREQPAAGTSAGAYFGWWNFASKLNLALAAGLALPVLDGFGYRPGARDAAALDTLTLAYCALPCLLKLVAVALLLRARMADPSGGWN